VRRKEKQITDAARIEAIFRKGLICRLALVDDGEPYIVPLNYGYRDGNLYFHSAAEGRKIGIIKKNPAVAFEIETDVELYPGQETCDWGCRFRSLMGTGRIEILTNPADKKAALEAIMEQQTGRSGWSFPDRAVEKTLCLKLKPAAVTGKSSGYGETS
jgi:nitroimidazol reductase NimA-like FMN-containing flavoprotein (pyridoxamine 5'-phosphate oxidase superfamily)